VQEPTTYQHELHYARWWANFKLGGGVLLLLIGLVALTGWSGGWKIAGFLVLIGGLLGVDGWKGRQVRGPQLKFGPEGIWTPAAGFHSWQQVWAQLKHEQAGRHRSVVEVQLYRHGDRFPFERVPAENLDMDLPEIEHWLRQYSLHGKTGY
jgi:hypothetical protein